MSSNAAVAGFHLFFQHLFHKFPHKHIKSDGSQKRRQKGFQVSVQDNAQDGEHDDKKELPYFFRFKGFHQSCLGQDTKTMHSGSGIRIGLCYS